MIALSDKGRSAGNVKDYGHENPPSLPHPSPISRQVQRNPDDS